MVPWQRWQRTREHLESQVLFIANAVATTLDHADLVVQPFDKSERHLVVRLTVGRDALPVTFDQRGELFERLQALPAEGFRQFSKHFRAHASLRYSQSCANCSFST